MKLNRTNNPIDRIGRVAINQNWDKIEYDFNNIVKVVSDDAFQQVVDSARLIWQAPVDEFSDLATTYPDAEEGWTVMTRDNGNVYRYYENGGWQLRQEISVGPVNALDNRFTRQFQEIEKVQKLATEIGMIDNDPSKAVDNYNLLNDYINGGNGRILFLNGGRFWISQKLVMTKTYTAIIGNNRDKNPNISCLVGSFADTILEVAIPAGTKGSYLQNISLDGSDVCTKGLDISGNNFHNNDFDTIYIQNINGSGLKIGTNNYTSNYNRISTSNCSVGLEIASPSNQQSNFTDCHFAGRDTGAIIGSVSNSLEGLRCINFDNCDFTSPGTPLKINKTLYAIKFNRCWIEKASSGILSDYLIELGTSSVLASGINFDTCFMQGNSKVRYVINWKNAADIGFLGGNKTLGYTMKFIDAANAVSVNRDSIFMSLDRVNPNNAINGRKINELFKLWVGDSSSSEAQYKTNIEIDLDAQTAGVGNGILIGSKRRSESFRRIAVTENGLLLGDGTSSPDTFIRRLEPNMAGMSGGDSFRVDGLWNSGRLMLGTYNIWVDASRNVRIKRGVPTSDTDGVIFNLSGAL